MAEDIKATESVPGESLKKIADKHLRHAEADDGGCVYGTLLRHLQVRPEMHVLFFDGNVRPFRNKKEISEAIAKGDDQSLLSISKRYMTAYGKLVWGKDRRWLLKSSELSENEQALRYVLPKDRKEGDHDRFHAILKDLWQHMRTIIFEVKTSVAGGRGTYTPSTNLSRRATPRNSTSSLASIPSSQSVGRRGRPPKPRTTEETFLIKVKIPGKWSPSRTEEAVLDIITSVNNVRKNSYPEIFDELLARHMARLDEMTQAEEDALTGEMSSTKGADEEKDCRVKLHGGPAIDDGGDTITGDAAPTGPTRVTTDEDVTMGDYANTDTAIDSRIVAQSETCLSRQTAPTVSSETKTREARTKQVTDSSEKNAMDKSTDSETIVPVSNQHSADNRPYLSMTAYIPPTLPQMMTVYITPFSHTARTAQPYIWPDAPVHPTSYNAFHHGIRLRANVPDSVSDDRFMMVFGYGWNDFCCVVRNEETWKNWFMSDLMIAARSGVGIWRMRVCCFSV